MTTFKGKLLPTQYKFVKDFSHREVAYVGGYGSGKTQAAACKAIKLAAMNKGFTGAILSPTHSMLIDTLVPTFEDTLISMGVQYTFTGGTTKPAFVLHWRTGKSKIICRSAENYRRLASLNLAWAIVDECDLIDKKLGLQMWKMLKSRLRVGNFRQLCATSTPEGFELLYEIFDKQGCHANPPNPDRHYYKASTYENHHLPDDYIPSLLADYSPAEIRGYLNGEFTNLLSSTVYHCFDRKDSNTDKTIDSFKFPALHIGCDFNVGKTCGIVCVVRKGIIYVIDEFVNQRDTDELIDAIKGRYPKNDIYIYPDSSGKSQQTATTLTDIALLKTAFGSRNVRYPNKNPKILNRVKAVNAMFLNGKGVRRMYVNTEVCTEITTCLEQQAYDPNTGKPDKKKDLDHPLDALGYFVHHTNPIIKKPTVRNI